VNITGNAGTATKLQSSVTINGVAFDGSANITVPAGVPYTGATQAVNLGAYDLAVNGITVGKGGGNYASNTAFGNSALSVNTTGGINNTAIGSGSLSSNTSGGSNTAIGKGSLNTNSTGSSITAIGMNALENNTTGSNNTAIGGGALSVNSTGGSNTAIGHGANVGSNNLTNATAIGSGAIVAADNTIKLGNDNIQNVYTSGTVHAGGFTTSADIDGNNITANGTVTAGSFITIGDIYGGANIVASGTLTAGTVTYPNTDGSANQVLSTTGTGTLVWSTPGPQTVTTTQRDAIATPAAGLTVWNTTNTQLEVYDGTDWVNMLGKKGTISTTLSTSSLKVGDSYGGGKVAYILTPNDPGYDAKETHGLIAATSDQSSGAAWGCYFTTITGADGTAIGTGNQNTIDIMAGCSTAGIAARICGDLVEGGYSDWYLPSKDELAKLYLNKVAIGGFSTNYYHSSSESSFSLNWMQDFNNGSPTEVDKVFAASVRAVRSF
jgi:hypothetical protein